MAIGGGVVGGQAPRHSAAPLPVVIDLPQGTMVYSIDVECVATGTLHNDRSIAQISLVDGASNVLANLYVKPDVPVVSHLTPLTGVTAELLDERGSTLEAALSELRRRLPPNSVLVGQNIL
jgi:RNA exonuclease 4